nr:MAG TPA: hypothetical protein [Caudoviricetes sp.]
MPHGIAWRPCAFNLRRKRYYALIYITRIKAA